MIEKLASMPQYEAHIAPLWDALPDEVKGPGDAVLVSSASDLRTVRQRNPRQRIVYMEHGIGQPYPNGAGGYPGGKGRGTVELFLSPNSTAAAADRRAYPAARVLEIGDPRLDTLPAREPGPLTVAISFHWDCVVCTPWTQSAFDHFRGAIAGLAAAFPVLGHAHPRAVVSRSKLYGKLGIPFEPSFDEIARRASVYVCDNSSTIFEAASLGIPVVLMNAPGWDRRIEFGLRFWAAADVGIQVDQPADLMRAVELALADPPEQRERRERALDLAYAFRSGAAQRGADVLMEWLTERAQVAA